MSRARKSLALIVVAGVVFGVACFADASEFNRWEVDTFEEMSSIIQQCYGEKDVDCIMDFFYVKGVPHNLVEDLRSKLLQYVENRTLIGVGYGPVLGTDRRRPNEVPGLRFDERIPVEPTYLPVEEVVFFNFGEPECSTGGSVTVCWGEAWQFWLATEQDVAYLVLEEKRPFKLPQRALDAFMMDWLCCAWWRSDWLVNEIRYVIPGHDDAYYHDELRASFLRLYDAGFAVLCPTETEHQPWWLAPSECPDRQDPRSLIEMPGFWEVDSEQPAGVFNWFTLTDEGEIEEERDENGYEMIRDGIDDYLEGRATGG